MAAGEPATLDRGMQVQQRAPTSRGLPGDGTVRGLSVGVVWEPFAMVPTGWVGNRIILVGQTASALMGQQPEVVYLPSSLVACAVL